MAETTITEQVVREAPEIEAYKLGLYQDAQQYIRDLQAAGIQPRRKLLLDLPKISLLLGTLFAAVSGDMNRI